MPTSSRATFSTLSLPPARKTEFESLDSETDSKSEYEEIQVAPIMSRPVEPLLQAYRLIRQLYISHSPHLRWLLWRSILQLTKLRAQIAEISDHIDELAKEISLLRGEKNALQAKLDAYVYPINALLPEITAEIFQQVVDDDDCPRYYALTISSVCRRWREVALGSYRLWSKLDMDFGSIVDPVSLSELLLSRSGRVPLDIRLSMFSANGASGPAFATVTDEDLALKVFTVAARYAERWQSLELDLQPDLVLYQLPFLALLPPIMPLLQTLIIKGCIDYTGWQSNVSFPCLHKIILYGTTLQSTLRPALPEGMMSPHALGSVTALTLLNTPHRDVLRILALSPHLETLDLEIISARDPPDDPSTPGIPLSALRALTCRATSTLPFLSDLHMPSLRSLKLSDIENDAVLVDAATTHESALGQSVRKLHFHNFRMPVNRLTRLLGLFPNTEDLTLEFSGQVTGWPRGTLVALSQNAVFAPGIQAPGQFLLPALQSFTLRGPSREANMSGLIDFLEARARYAELPRLRHLGIDFLAQMDLSEEMETLGSLGPELELRDIGFAQFDSEDNGE
ncbi:MYND-type domain-containing protein [Mycena chlorophos]|uniref:MYND-type domain-containing protein n=1 Tax=Mycena chlorophos TaxID=658473 RepID=A0A8H6VSK8_MYCCL|nr:MYND-type domain-containing protein [Mycena chlorophos]